MITYAFQVSLFSKHTPVKLSFLKGFQFDNATLCFQHFPCRAPIIKSAKHAGPGYALPLSRCAVGRRYLCLNCPTKSKHPVAMS